VQEISSDGHLVYEGRFDEDDFQGAYRELERRYYAGEGAALAEMGAVGTDFVLALNTGDIDRLLGELSEPDFRIKNRSRSFLPDRSADEFRASLDELHALVGSARTWNSALYCPSPTWAIARQEREAVGRDGENYAWSRLVVSEFRNGRFGSICEFDIEDEEAAFAYAEEGMRATASRLSVENRSTRTAEEFWKAIRARDVDEMLRCCSEAIVYDDRRSISGNPIRDHAGFRAAFERILAQYNRFDERMLAVRGERVHLAWSRWFNDSGYETTYLHVSEVDDDGKIIFEGRFDGDDFVAAYRELDRRYYAGEGVAFSDEGAVLTEWHIALNQRDFDRVFGELTDPDMRVENRSSSVFGDRTASDIRASLEELDTMVDSARSWHSAVRWLSPHWVVARLEREAVGSDGEHYAWSWLDVYEFRGRLMSACRFEVDDEAAAFTYAEERLRATVSRLAVSNRASRTAEAVGEAIRAGNADQAAAHYSEQWVSEDRRRLSGESVVDARGAAERILQQYTQFDRDTLAVRGERNYLGWSRWSNTDGYETTYLHVQEIGEDGRFVYDCIFDEADFVDAYRELNRRYYADEGAPFASAGATVTEYVIALHEGDLERVSELSAPDFQLENRSRSIFGDRTAAEFRAGQEELNTMVTSVRTFNSVMCWLSPAVAVSRFEREAIGRDGERYAWSFVIVSEIHGGRVARVRQFEVEDEEAAFAYAEELASATDSRLAMVNRASRTVDGLNRASSAADVDRVVGCFAEQFVFDDRRRLSGDPVRNAADLHRGIERIFAQYNHFEWRSLAVRGERLCLNWSRWWDDSGNETAYFHVREVDDVGKFIYDGRFDEDDFDGAYRELDRRYRDGEGTAYAESIAASAEWLAALNQRDFDGALNDLSTQDLRVESRSRSGFPERSLADLRTSLRELDTMVTSVRTWNSAIRWLSPAWSVARMERTATGLEGQPYEWTRIYVTGYRDGRVASLCEFELDDEDAAFAYAEECVRAAATRLAIVNRASETFIAAGQAADARDVDAVVACYAEGFEYDDRRRMAGNPLGDLRAANERILEQYNKFDGRTLAVRGEALQLGWGRWSNDAGYETTFLFVHEVADSGRFTYEGRFDEDDFEGAYRTLEHRYYAGAGAAFAEAAATMTEFTMALNQGNLDRILTQLTTPDFRVMNRSRAVFDDRSADEFRGWEELLATMVASTRNWSPAVCWLSPTSAVLRFERDALGPDNEQYTWTGINVVEFRDGRMASTCLFEADEEEAAFAYAEERVRASASRLAVTNRAKMTWDAMDRAWHAHDLDSVIACHSPALVHDEHRRVSGLPVDDIRTAIERIANDYSQIEMRSLAARGDHLHLGLVRWWNESGFESSSLWVHQVDDDGIVISQARFDEDDFEGAYRELEERYYAGEGAAFAEAAMGTTESIIAMNNGDFDRLFSEFFAPELRVENRSRSAFGDRTAAQFRASLEHLNAMVATARAWHSVVCWLSPSVGVGRFERTAVGKDGERYTWVHIQVNEIRDGRLASMCEFELDDEDAAFAYAEERVRASATRLPNTNRASRTADRLQKAFESNDADAVAACFTDSFVFDDRHRFVANPVGDVRVATERIFEQYTQFEGRSLAVRGERLHLGWCRWSNEAGFETTYLFLHEVDDEGRIVYQARFDEDDFNTAYRELEKRYCAGEGAPFADLVAVSAEWMIALNNHDFDLAFDQLTDPAARVENRSRGVFPDRSAAELRASFEDLYAMVATVRSWNSAECPVSSTCSVVRHEREAVGPDGEKYSWTRIYVFETRDGRATGWCEFDPADEAAAFAYAEQHMRRGEPS
jgi:ketosteroid isomerase-like protein